MIEFGYTDCVDTPGSSFCKWAGYNKNEQKVLFRLNGGKYLIYGDVDYSLWEDLVEADSFGRFYQQEIRGKYTPLASDRDDVDTLKVYEVVSADAAPELSQAHEDYLRGKTLTSNEVRANLGLPTQGEKNVQRRYVVTAEFDSFEAAALFASYAAPTSRSLSLDSYNEEV